jgi:DNA end-binding protein Ku
MNGQGSKTMARAIWKGSVTFGLVNIPVSLFPAEAPKESISFSMIDKRDNGRIGYERVNKNTGKPVPWEDVVKGFEYSEGEYVILSDEEIKQFKAKGTQTVDIQEFVKIDDVDWTYFEKPYYLVPDKRGQKTYALLRETLKRTGLVGVARVVIQTKQHLCLVAVRGPAIMIELIRYAHELRRIEEFEFPPEHSKDFKLNPKELAMAERLVEEMAGEWKPDKYEDTYHDEVMQLIENKARTGKLTPVEEADEEAGKKVARGVSNVMDLMPLLKQSIEQRGKGTKAPAKARPRKKAGRAA